MRAFSASRVVVIDDRWIEVEPLLKALWGKGIGAVYSNGVVSDPAPERLSGVRLVFLDLDLQNLGGPPHAFLNTTIGVLDTLIELKQPGIGIVYWTKHPEHAKEFEKLLGERVKYFRPAFLIPQEKIKYVNEAPVAVEQLQADIARALEVKRAYGFLCAWEGAVLEGAVSTTAALCPDGESEEDCMKAMAALASGAGGTSASSPEGAVLALCEAMHELLSDAIPPKGLFDRVKGFGGELHPRMSKALKKISDPVRYRLNRLLLLDPDPSEMTASSPGAVVVSADMPELAKQRQESADTAEEVLSFVKCQKAWLLEEVKEAWGTEVAETTKAAIPVFVNVSPPCDVAQDNCPQSRLLGGLLVKVPAREPQHLQLKLLAEVRLFGKELPRFSLSGVAGIPDGTYWMVLNSRRLFSAPSSGLAKVRATFALRSAVVSDVLAWFAAHAARPGIISV